MWENNRIEKQQHKNHGTIRATQNLLTKVLKSEVRYANFYLNNLIKISTIYGLK